MIEHCSCCGQAITEPLVRCKCGHPVLTHHLTPANVRTWCSVWDEPAGQCTCTRATTTEE